MADDLRPPLDLYEQDFFVWTQEQARALRAARPVGVEWERVAEELEDMGKRDLRSAQSLVARIIEHLMVIEASARREPIAHWRVEIVTFQSDLRRIVSPSIRRKLLAELEESHREAAWAVAKKLAAFGDRASPEHLAQRWSLPQILGEEDYPLDAQ